ncbi:hypothetical protein FOMPIDRAFT_89150 [Fomitopsis schrenkii]|uniref:F-box domain-containing protein n=1 Tax=Fomitopsis schrenkii TaxID=2126942 RepID=S8E397_FOMSC|nr:hypothetical protein FOMPIDRAFT_89150 [Fomitopsis schrenkii]
MYLHQHTHGEPLLPNLRELLWEHASADIIAVLSPTIRVLRLPAEIEEEMLDEQDELAFRTRRHALKTLLPDVLRGLPELGCLQLSPLGHIEHWHKLVDKREGSFAARRLASLWLMESLPVLMNGALQLLSTSTQLEQLLFTLLHRDGSKPLGSVSSLEPCTYTFRELQTLYIDGSMVAMELVMNTINAPELKHVDIGLCELGGSARVHHILQKILTTLSSRSKSIHTCTLGVSSLAISPQTLFFTMMEPLSQLRLLQDVTIDMPHGYEGRTVQVPPDLFESWPGLKTLSLGRVHISPEALQAAARSFPGLQSLTVLQLSGDFARHPYVVAAATCDARTLATRDGHGLRTLGLLGSAGFTDYLEVINIASFLVALFPSLRVEPLEGLKERWSPIVTEISRIQAAR